MLVKYELTKSEPRDHVKKRNYDEEKEVVHIEFDLPEESELTFTAGDALGVYPLNKPSEVAALLSSLVGHQVHSEKGKEKEEESKSERVKAAEKLKVPMPKSAYEDPSLGGAARPRELTLAEALTRYYDLKAVKAELVTTLLKLFNEQEDSVKDGKEKAFLEKLLANGGASLKENTELREFLNLREVADVLEAFPTFFSQVSTPLVLGDILGKCLLYLS